MLVSTTADLLQLQRERMEHARLREEKDRKGGGGATVPVTGLELAFSIILHLCYGLVPYEAYLFLSQGQINRLRSQRGGGVRV